MNFYPDLHPQISSRNRAFTHGFANLFECLINRDAFVGLQAIGAHFNARATHVGGEFGVFNSPINIFAHNAGIIRMIFKRRAQTRDFDPTILKLFADILPLSRRKVCFNAVSMRGTQFSTAITEFGTVFDNSGNIPVRGDLIRDNTQLHFYLPISSSQPRSVSKTKGQKLKVDELAVADHFRR